MHIPSVWFLEFIPEGVNILFGSAKWAYLLEINIPPEGGVFLVLNCLCLHATTMLPNFWYMSTMWTALQIFYMQVLREGQLCPAIQAFSLIPKWRWHEIVNFLSTNIFMRITKILSATATNKSATCSNLCLCLHKHQNSYFSKSINSQTNHNWTS